MAREIVMIDKLILGVAVFDQREGGRDAGRIVKNWYTGKMWRKFAAHRGYDVLSGLGQDKTSLWLSCRIEQRKVAGVWARGGDGGWWQLRAEPPKTYDKLTQVKATSARVAEASVYDPLSVPD
jgi:hypothetical protein